jgi:hypothetical protein
MLNLSATVFFLGGGFYSRRNFGYLEHWQGLVYHYQALRPRIPPSTPHYTALYSVYSEPT